MASIKWVWYFPVSKFTEYKSHKWHWNSTNSAKEGNMEASLSLSKAGHFTLIDTSVGITASVIVCPISRYIWYFAWFPPSGMSITAQSLLPQLTLVAFRSSKKEAKLIFVLTWTFISAHKLWKQAVSQLLLNAIGIKNKTKKKKISRLGRRI